MSTSVMVDGGLVNVGESIGFKDDVEQYGKLVKIDGIWLTISVFDGVTGDRYNVTQPKSRCWKA